MAYRIQARSDTANNWSNVNPTLAQAEFAWESDTQQLKIGDGVTPWATLPYWGGGNGGGGTNYSNANANSFMASAQMGNLIPMGDGVFSLGNTTNQWKDLWITGNTIYIDRVPLSSNGNGGLQFGPNAIVSATPAGVLNVPNVSTTGSITAGTNLSAAGNITGGGTLTIPGNVTFGQDMSVAGNTVNGGNLIVGPATGPNAITFNGNTGTATFGNSAVPGANSVTINGPNATVSAGSGANAITMNGTSGQVAIGNAAAGNGITMSANGAISTTGNVTSNNVIANTITATTIVTPPGSNLVIANVANVQNMSNVGNLTQVANISNVGNLTGVNTMSNINTLSTINTVSNINTMSTINTISNVGNLSTVGNISNVGTMNGITTISNVSTISTVGNISNVQSIQGNAITANLFTGNFASPGNNTQILFNDNGLIGANSYFTADKSTGTISVANTLSANTVTVGSGAMTMSGAFLRTSGNDMYLDPLGDGLSTTGNVWVLGNLQVKGNTVFSSVTNSNTSNLVYNAADGIANANAAAGAGLTVGPNATPYATWTYNPYLQAWQSNIAIVANGNVTGTNFIGSGSYLSNIIWANITGANANVEAWLGVSPTIANLSSNVTNLQSNVANLQSNMANVQGNVTILQGNVANLTNVVANLSGTAYSNANTGNLLSSGNLTTNVVTQANVIGGNILSNGIISTSGNVVGGNISTTGNIQTNGNITGNGFISVAGNVAGGNVTASGNMIASGNVTGGNLNTSGTVSAIGNVSGGNVTTSGDVSAAGNVYADYFSGNFVSPGVNTQLIFNDAGLMSANAYFTVNKATGTMTVANTMAANTFSAGPNAISISGAFMRSGGNDIYLDPKGDGLNSTGNVWVLGNLHVGGNITYTSVTSATTANLIYYAASTAANANTASGGGLAVGPNTAPFATWTYNAYLNAWQSNIPIVANGNVVGTNFIGNGTYLANLTWANITGANANVANFLASGTMNTVISTSGNIVGGNVSTVGNVSGGNVSTTGTVTSTTVTATGNISGGNVSTSGNVTASNVNTQTLTATTISTTGGITTSGNLTAGNISGNAGTFSGNVTAANISTSGTITGNGAGLSGIPANAVTGLANLLANAYGNANVSAYLGSNTYVGNIVIPGSITAKNFYGDGGTLSNISIAGGNGINNVSNINGTNVISNTNVINGTNTISNTVTIANTTTIANTNTISGTNTISNTNTISTVNTISNIGTLTTINTLSNINTLTNVNTVSNIGSISNVANISNVSNISGVANLQANTANINTLYTGNITANGLITGDGGGLSNIPASAITGLNQYSNANVANYLPGYGGNLSAGNISVIGNVQALFFKGDGGFLTNVQTNYSNTNVAAYLPTNSSNIAGNNLNLVGNIAAGNSVTAAYLVGNIAFATGGYSNTNVASYLPNNTSNVNAMFFTASGNVTAAYYHGNGRFLTGILTLSDVANYLPTYTGNLSPGNISVANNVSVGGNVAANGLVANSGTIAGNLTVANLIVTGNTTSSSVNNVTTNNAIMFLANNQNGLDAVEIGVLGHYGNIMGINQYGGLIRDHSTETWRFVANIRTQPGATVDFANVVYPTVWTGPLQTVGNVVVGNAGAGYIYGNGAFLTGLPTGYSDNDVIAVMESGNVANIVATGDIYANSGLIQASYMTVANSITAGYFYGNGSGLTGLYSNSNVISFLPNNTSNISGDVITGNVLSSTGNVVSGNVNTGNVAAGNANFSGTVTATRFVGDGSGLSNTHKPVMVQSNITGVLAGVPILVDVDLANAAYPGGVFTIYQPSSGMAITVSDVWASTGSLSKNQYSNFAANQVNTSDVTLGLLGAGGTFNVKTTDTIQIGNSIITGPNLVGLGIAGTGGNYTIPAAWIANSDQTASTIAVAVNLTMMSPNLSNSVITSTGANLTGVAPIPFSVANVFTAAWAGGPYISGNVVQTFNWAFGNGNTTGNVISGTVNLTGSNAMTLASNGAISATSPTMQSNLGPYNVNATYFGSGLNGAGNITINVSGNLAPAAQADLLYYKYVAGNSANVANFANTDPHFTTSFWSQLPVHANNAPKPANVQSIPFDDGADYVLFFGLPGPKSQYVFDDGNFGIGNPPAYYPNGDPSLTNIGLYFDYAPFTGFIEPLVDYDPGYPENGNAWGTPPWVVPAYEETINGITYTVAGRRTNGASVGPGFVWDYYWAKPAWGNLNANWTL